MVSKLKARLLKMASYEGKVKNALSSLDTIAKTIKKLQKEGRDNDSIEQTIPVILPNEMKCVEKIVNSSSISENPKIKEKMYEICDLLDIHYVESDESKPKMAKISLEGEPEVKEDFWGSLFADAPEPEPEE